jgi:hypothetical protein
VSIKPSPAEVLKAIEIYLRLAYRDRVPSAVQNRVHVLQSLPTEEFYDNGMLERDDKNAPTKFSLRLGNEHYPHMKLTIERSPDQNGYLFRANTHDRHCCPAEGSREYGMFCELMDKNKAVADKIEAEWAEQGIATFKTYLRDDLQRRKAK